MFSVSFVTWLSTSEAPTENQPIKTYLYIIILYFIILNRLDVRLVNILTSAAISHRES